MTTPEAKSTSSAPSLPPVTQVMTSQAPPSEDTTELPQMPVMSTEAKAPEVGVRSTPHLNRDVPALSAARTNRAPATSARPALVPRAAGQEPYQVSNM